MHDLQLLGVHEDGEHVVLLGSDGQRYRVPIDDALRAAARRDRARLGQLQIAVEGAIRPREIQARIRSGQTAEEVAASAGVPIEHVRRYEGPVLAERESVVLRARNAVIRRRDGSAHTLALLADDRLTARGVDLDRGTLWDAWREEDGTWTVQVLFSAGGKERHARWRFDLPTAHLTPADDESTWLTSEQGEAPSRPTRDQAAQEHEGALDRILRRRLETVEIPTAWRRSTPEASRAFPIPVDPGQSSIEDELDTPVGPSAPVAAPVVVEPVEEKAVVEEPKAAEPETPRPAARATQTTQVPEALDADDAEIEELPVVEDTATEAPTESEGPAHSEVPADSEGPEQAEPAVDDEPVVEDAVEAPAEEAPQAEAEPAEDRAPEDADEEDFPPPAHPADSHPEDHVDATVIEEPEKPAPAKKPAPPKDAPAKDEPAKGEEQAEEPAAAPEEPEQQSLPIKTKQTRTQRKPSSKKGRTSVPSWDDILFGAKKD